MLIPLGAAAFLSLGRHPIAGLAAAFSGVAAVFGVNLIITPVDGVLTEITNDAIHLLNPNILAVPDGEPVFLDRVEYPAVRGLHHHHRTGGRASAWAIPRREANRGEHAATSAKEARACGTRCTR